MQRTTLTQELLAEFLGTFVLIVFGVGVVAQTVLTDKGGGFLSITWAWGLAVTMGVYVAGGVSGAHINPAVTLAFAMKRGFSWNKVVPYWVAQTVGAFVAAAVVFIVYRESFDAIGYGIPWIKDNLDPSAHNFGTAGIFATYSGYTDGAVGYGAGGHPIGLLTGMLDQIVGTALLTLVLAAVIDVRNTAVSANMGAFIIGLIVVVIGMTFGANYGYAINPARDLGPRIFTLFTHGFDVFNATGPNYFWVPIIGPLIGGPLGVYVYDWFVGNFLPSAPDEPGRTLDEPTVASELAR